MAQAIGAKTYMHMAQKTLVLIYEMFTREGKRNRSFLGIYMRLFASLKTQKKKEEN